MLRKLRNDETHFYIDRTDYLSDNQFMQLYNLMVNFYCILIFYHMVPFLSKDAGKNKRFSFEREKISDFTYRSHIVNAKFVRNLKERIGEKDFPNKVIAEPYSIADDIADICKVQDEDKFDELWAYIQMLMKYQLLEVVNITEKDDADGHLDLSPYHIYRFKF